MRLPLRTVGRERVRKGRPIDGRQLKDGEVVENPYPNCGLSSGLPQFSATMARGMSNDQVAR
jgi:hypothetical protein